MRFSTSPTFSQLVSCLPSASIPGPSVPNSARRSTFRSSSPSFRTRYRECPSPAGCAPVDSQSFLTDLTTLSSLHSASIDVFPSLMTQASSGIRLVPRSGSPSSVATAHWRCQPAAKRWLSPRSAVAPLTHVGSSSSSHHGLDPLPIFSTSPPPGENRNQTATLTSAYRLRQPQPSNSQFHLHSNPNCTSVLFQVIHLWQYHPHRRLPFLLIHWFRLLSRRHSRSE
ncbi:uncharacterized protein LOC122843320 [Gambusia affinis]|uniref:uncharacterized protein LOC122843320 n=1 Tax=Gambusia affinis TaxID=33528 RepID=UPI001CDBA101|nr:uncharacterized protein LOC122843320 [Gambusia affinis]